MPLVVTCMEPVETARGLHLPCVRERGHEGPHNTGRCASLFHEDGVERSCTLHRGHSGGHRSWVEAADVEREYEPLEPREGRDDLGWR